MPRNNPAQLYRLDQHRLQQRLILPVYDQSIQGRRVLFPRLHLSLSFRRLSAEECRLAATFVRIAQLVHKTVVSLLNDNINFLLILVKPSSSSLPSNVAVPLVPVINGLVLAAIPIGVNPRTRKPVGLDQVNMLLRSLSLANRDLLTLVAVDL
jgi:hypothetical protein